MNDRAKIDAILLSKARSGDNKAFTKLFTHYYNSVFLNIINIVKTQEDAEDLTMVTFEKAFFNLNKYAPTFGFGTWLNKIGKNTAFDYLIHKKRRPMDSVELDDSLSQKFTAKNPEELYLNKELGERVDKAVDELQDNYKDIIKLRYYEDLEFDEISLKLGISKPLIRSHLFRATRKLSSVKFQ